MPEQGAQPKANIPRHVAIIMDGNGRWAAARGLPRTAGHKRGAEAVKRAVQAAGDVGIEYLTLFGFSSENWSRPADEVNELMRLLRVYLRSETADLHRNGVRLKVIGDRAQLAPDIVDLIVNAESLTAGNPGVTLTIALNYGGRHDILQAACRTAAYLQQQGIAPDFSAIEEHFPGFLMSSDLPDPDVLVRTSGEQRISNFMLWACAYSEFVFLPTLWPDFSIADLQAVIAEYQKRDRRFGALSQKG